MRKIITIIAINVLIFGMALTTSAETYEVEKGDNLWRIAKDHDMTVSHLMEINDLKSITIYPEQLLETSETYVVEKGDTLSHIGLDFNVTVKELKEWNDLTSDLIVVDQKLDIYQTQSSKASKQKARKKQASTVKSSDKTAHKASTSPVKSSKNDASTRSVQGETLSVVATAYTAECDGCTGITYTGVDLNKDRNAKVIAVDPDVIPLGSEVYVEGYGHAVAEDIGGAIKGHKIDIHVPTKKEAYDWGVRDVEITVLDQ